MTLFLLVFAGIALQGNCQFSPPILTPPSPLEFYKQNNMLALPPAATDLSSWHCGIDDNTKLLSIMAVGLCPHEPLNTCCLQHDMCYGFNRLFVQNLRSCDEIFGLCVRTGYQNNQFCANWLYNTHVETVRVFGEPYKQTYG